MPRFLAPLLLVFFVVSTVADASCSARNVDARHEVVYAHDGDTLWLEDGDRTSVKLRIIGINAPEVGNRHNKKSVAEPFGIAARDALRERVMGRVVLLDFDEEKLDRYKRLLAHVFFLDGMSVAAWLLSQGLAQAAPVGPNFEYIDCYTRADRQARSDKLGLWNHPYFAPKPAEQLGHGDNGFMLVRGCVVSRSVHREFDHIYLSDAFRFKMDKSLPSLRPGQCLIVRGWVYNDRSYPGKGMSVSHQAAIESVYAEP